MPSQPQMASSSLCSFPWVPCQIYFASHSMSVLCSIPKCQYTIIWQCHSLTASLNIQCSEQYWLAGLKLLAFAVPPHQVHLLCILGVNHNQHPLGSHLHSNVQFSINIISGQSITHCPLINRPLEDTCSHSTGFQCLPSACLTSLLQTPQPFALLWEQASLRHQPLWTQQSQALPNNHIRIIIMIPLTMR